MTRSYLINIGARRKSRGFTLTLTLSHQGRGDKGIHKGCPYGVIGIYEMACNN